ncbi:MAG: uroporphyrinogen-III C-methyltransferase [Lachnospiraceae bacterium]|nr:uroporphyrinogen-III C-methyltransferase [Lachnospiraceae bacterium]
MSGKVWLVGAGPGDAGLFTLKGKEVLENADVVVYDALVGAGILSMIPEKAELIFAGKRSGNHYLKQEDTNRVLLEEAQKGKNVVRLKGGDPFLFGRGGEELELLAENDIPFEIVPGITSAFAVPAYNGIPVTHRDFCSSVHVITGHKRGNNTYDIDFKALVDTKGTLVFLMGIAALPDLTKGLLDAGMDPDMPTAILERGTTADQHRITGTLGTIVDICSRTTVLTPAIIVVGKVVKLNEDFAWFEKRPLAGVKVCVTRPKELISTMSSLLRKEGAEVLEMPAIAVKPVEDKAPVEAAIEDLSAGKYQWIVFTSPSGVRNFMDELFAKADIRALASVRIASIGKGSEKALNGYGLKSDFIPSVYDGETLGKELAEKLEEGDKVLIPRAAIGNPQLVEELQKKANVTVDDIATYDTVYETSHVLDEHAAMESNPFDLAVFTSASTVKGFTESLKGMDFTKVNAVCIGKQTEAAAKGYGMKTWTASKATLKDLVECVKIAAKELKEERE